ncbi:hypothetical protein WJX72_002274 [[Myrmecia] bisecta]|uniref:Uncharacterized protein n=1 Tax=[Myrmecia] bisecta TaxID=41462 RepID=A0AAW1R520_9CHLO
MSKKNNLNTRKKQHKFDLEREKAAAIEKQRKQEKKARQQKADSKLAASGNIKKGSKAQRRGFRIKKGVTIKGIKITDAASKKKALQVLAAEQAMREMDVESPIPSEKSAGGAAAPAAAMDLE